MEGQGDGRHNGPNCYRIPLPIGNGARNMETLGLRVFILNQEIIFSIHAMIRPPDNDMHDDDDDGNTEDNDEEQNIQEQNIQDNMEEDDDNVDDVDREENIEDEEDEDDSEDSDGDADVEDNDGDVEDNHHGAHPDYPAEVLVNDENAVLLFRIRVRPLQHGDVFDDIFLELRLVNNDDFDEIDNNEEHNADANVENIDDDDGFENNNSDDRDRSRDGDGDGDGDGDDDDDDALEDDGCRDDEGFEDVDRDRQSVRDRAVVGSVADQETKDALGPAVCRDSDDPLPGPSGERSVQDPDDAGGGKQFQWWDESNSDSFSDNSGEEEERPLRRAGASKRRSSDDVDSQDDKGGKKSRKKNFLSNSEDEDFACRSSERESSRKRRRGERGAPCETARNQKRFRHGDTSDSEPDEPGRSATPSERSRDHPEEDETRDGQRDFAPSPSTSPAGRIPPVARHR